MDADLDWLRSLEPRLWVEKETTDYYNMSGTSARRKYLAESGERLTEEDLTRLHEIVLRRSLPVQICNTKFGFGVGLVVHEPERAPLYPGLEAEEKPEVLVVISQEHLPLSQSTFEPPDRIMFDDGWRVFSPLTHSDENKALLQRCGLPKPEPKGHYEY
jgi:hypothetical protein